MWIFWLFFLLPALVHVKKTEEFAQSVMHSVGNTNPAVILDLEQVVKVRLSLEQFCGLPEMICSKLVYRLNLPL